MSTLKQSGQNVEKTEVELFLIDGDSKSDESKPRPVWNRKIEYMLSLIGYTVGISSVWRFPYLCLRNGGGAFLIPFVFFMVMFGCPLYFLELALGQFSGKSPMVLWSICPLLKGIGYCSVLISFIVTWYYGLVIAWILVYLFYSFYPTQPWSTCDNSWNSPNCISSRTREVLNTNQSVYDGNTTAPSVDKNASLTYYPTAANEFWRFCVLNESKGIEDLGSLQWHIVLALFVCNGTCFLCIIKGVKSVGKVVYVTALLPYILLCVILIKSLTLDGSVNGVIYFLRPDFSRLMDFQVWIEAALQVFFSLGPAWGGVITMASYSRFNNKCLSDAVMVTVADCFTALFCGLVVFSIIGFLANEAGMSITEVSESGPGLVFQAYPEVLTRLPLPQLWAVLFFIMLFTVGLDSQFGMLETVVSGLTDMFPQTLGNKKKRLILCVFIVYFLLSLIYATQAGVYIFQLIDWYATVFVIFVISLLECVVVGHIYGAERFSRDVEMMIGKPIPIFMRISICILTPIAMFVVIIATVLNYEHPSYKGYDYPDYVGGIGMMIALVSVVPVPVTAVYQIVSSQGSLKQKLKSLAKPSKEWGPNGEENRSAYKHYKYEGSCWEKVKQDILG